MQTSTMSKFWNTYRYSDTRYSDTFASFPRGQCNHNPDPNPNTNPNPIP